MKPFPGLSQPLTIGGAVVKFNRVVRIQQPVQMNDHVLDVGLVDGGLAGPAPGLEGGIVIGENADDVEPVRVGKFGPLRLGDLAPENKMQKRLIHEQISR